MAIIGAAPVVPLAGSLYSGLCLYINGMVADMKTRISCPASALHHGADRASRWPIYVQEIDFHNEIIEYDFGVFEHEFHILFFLFEICSV